MATQDTKIDLINGAYSQLRISGITLIPSPRDISLALRRLESCIAELFALNISFSYNFEEEPDVNSPHNLERKFWDPVEVYLAYRLAPDFGKEITKTLAQRLKGAMSSLFKLTVSTNRVAYPTRMPKGKSRGNKRESFFPVSSLTPNESKTIVIYIGDRNSFIESFLQLLNDEEIISTYTIEADNEITINSDSNTDSAISFDITAEGNLSGSTMVAQIKIQITTDTSRILTRILNLKLMESEI